MPDEVKAENTATTATADVTTTTPVQVEQTTAPVENTQTTETTTTNTDTKTDTTSTPKDTGLSKGVKTEMYKLRAERRELREKIERLEKLVGEKANAVNQPAEEPFPALLDDPEKRLALTEQRAIKTAKAEAIAEFQRMQTESVRVKQIEAEGQQTIEMLLNKPEINGDMSAIEQIDEIILNDPRLAEVVKISPQLAGNAAYEMWCKDKGIDTNSKKVASVAKVASSAPASTSMTAKPPMTMSDIQREAAKLDPSDPKFNEKWQYLISESQKVSK